MFKKYQISILIFIFTHSAWSQKQTQQKYPYLSFTSGKVYWSLKNQPESLAKTQLVFTEKALIRTDNQSEAVVILDEDRRFYTLPNTTVLLPAISWPEGRTPLVVIQSGSLRWQQSQASHQQKYNIALQAELFEFISPPGHFQLSYFPQTAYAEVRMYAGQMEFSATHSEDSILVKAGQSVGFQGILEEGKPVFDILLNGKKIPRGKLTSISEVSAKEMQEYSEASLKAKELALQQKKQQAAAAQAKKRKEAGFICSQPDGVFNEIKNKNKTPHRCNANGEWKPVTW